jgi:hypothetical protein
VVQFPDLILLYLGMIAEFAIVWLENLNYCKEGCDYNFVFIFATMKDEEDDQTYHLWGTNGKDDVIVAGDSIGLVLFCAGLGKMAHNVMTSVICVPNSNVLY